MDLHLDDRLLHGRILHGWAPRLKPQRFVLVASGLPARAEFASYAAAAAELGISLHGCDPWVDPLPAPAAGDFWIADAPAAAARLLEAGLRPLRLVVIGLRDADTAALAPDFAPGPASRRALAALAAGGLPVLVQPFPAETAIPLAALLAGGTREER